MCLPNAPVRRPSAPVRGPCFAESAAAGLRSSAAAETVFDSGNA